MTKNRLLPMKIIIVFIISFILIVNNYFVANGLTPEERKGLFTPFYDSEEVCSNQTIGLGALDYAGRPILNDVQLAQINANRPFYENSASKYNIPWQMLAVIHKNESNLKRDNPTNGQGIYQFVNKNGGPYPPGSVSDEEFQRQTDLAAQFLLTKVPSGKSLSENNSDEDTIKDTFFGYNGRASVYGVQAANLGFDIITQPFEGSPYVMNKVDLIRDPTVEPTKSNSTWGQIKIDFGPIQYPANDFYGAFTTFAALAGGIIGVDGSCIGSLSSDLVQKIVQLLEIELALGANERDGTHTKYGGGQTTPWCGYFISWIYKEAGFPFEDGTMPAVQGILDYAKNNNTFYAANDPNFTPQTGDVAIYKEDIGPYPSHVHFVISYDPATRTYISIGGNEGDSIRKRTNSMDSISLTGFMRR